ETEALTQVIARRQGVPIFIMVDVLEQYYRKSTIPRVGFFDRSRVIRRKLDMAFPVQRMKAAIPLKEEGEHGASRNYLMAAIPDFEELRLVADAIAAAKAPIAGIVPLPLESVDMIERLAEATISRDRLRKQWTMLVSDNGGNGIRQIVVKDGNLALTRLTPPPTVGQPPRDMAVELVHEFDATLSYLKRMGFVASDGLDVIVVANKQVGDALFEVAPPTYNIVPLQPSIAARLLGLDMPQGTAGGVLHLLYAAWLGRKWHPVMPLMHTGIKSQHVQIVGARWVIVILSLMAVFMIWKLLDSSYFLLSQYNRKAEMIVTRDKLDRLIRRERLELTDFDVTGEQIEATLNIHDRLDKERIDPLLLLDDVGEALGSDLRVKSLIWRIIDQDEEVDSARSRRQINDDEAMTALRVSLTMELEFPTAVDIEEAVRTTNDLASRLSDALPDYKIRIEQQVANILSSETFSGGSGPMYKDPGGETRSAIIRVTGPEGEL
ncbi:MAG: hypothetical protein U9N14_05835, partial [Pseudomonadota bacterium]|nr:hypothetical protein [Pseudomonadota bacterium]